MPRLSAMKSPMQTKALSGQRGSRRRAPGVASLLLLVFDFDGTFLFEERLLRAPGTMAAPLPPPDDGTDDSPQDMSPDGQAPDIGLRYFIDRP